MSNITYPRSAILDARIGIIVATSVLLAFLTFFFICHIVTIYALRPGEIYTRHNRWRIYLFLTTISEIAGATMLLSSVAHDWRPFAGSCVLLMSFLTMVFVNIRQFTGLVLYSRAKVVHDGLRLKHSNLLIFREFLWYSMTIGVWVVFGWSYWVNYAGKVVPEGICVLFSKVPVVVLTFAILDAVMSLGMMMLFIVPLTSHTREMVGMAANNNISGKLTKIIRYNFGLSLLLTTMDTLSLVVMTILLDIADGEVVDPAVEHLQIWALLGPCLAVLISTVGLHSMTWSWMPRRIRVWFDRSTFSANDLNVSSGAQNQLAGEAGVIFLGNIHADGETIETQIQLRHYAVPFDTLNSRIFGLRFAKWIARSYQSHRWMWRTLIFTVMSTLSVLGILILMGLVPSWLSWFCLTVMVFTLVTDNNYSISAMKLLLKRFGPVVRLLVSFGAMILMFDVAGWDERCATIATMFIGMQYAYFTDALVRESREVFLYTIYLLSPMIPFWTLILLQGDFIAGRHNTVLVVTTVQRYEYSVYLATRDIVFLLCLLSLKDMVNVGRGKGRDCFLFLNGDVAIRVVGLGESKRTRQVGAVPAQERGDTPTNPEGSFDVSERSRSPTQSSAKRSGFLPRLSSIEGRNPFREPGQNDVPRATGEAAQEPQRKIMLNMIELRERDSLVVRIFGPDTGSTVLRVYTEPWFRLLNEWLLGFPIALFTFAVLPGFIDVRFSYLLLLAIVPFLRNFGLKSARLLVLLVFRFDFLLEATIVYGAIIICMVTYLEREKACFAVYCLLFWLDVRTNDARCVFFHTGTRRGRRLSPFERFLFRLASLQVALAFIVLPVLLIIGVTAHADYFMGFKFVQNGRQYPDDLDWVFLYQTSTTATSLQCWKLILDVYTDLYRRGKGIHLRYIRAPVAPTFLETSSAGAEGPRDSSARRHNATQTQDVFAATYRSEKDQATQNDDAAIDGADTVTGTITAPDPAVAPMVLHTQVEPSYF